MQVNLKPLSIKRSSSQHLTYTLLPPAPDTEPAAQPRAMTASGKALGMVQRPDIIRLSGWSVTAELLDTMPALQPACAVVLAADMVWPPAGAVAAADGAAAAADLCRRLGGLLSAAAGAHWVVHDSCGVANLAHMVAGRVTPAGVVHVVTQDAGFVSAVAAETRALLGPLLAGMCQLHQCDTLPPLSSLPLPALTPEHHQAERDALTRVWKEVKEESGWVAGALQAEADAAAAAARVTDAARIGAKAADAAALRTRAEQVLVRLEQGEVVGGGDMVAPWEQAQRLWASASSEA